MKILITGGADIWQHDCLGPEDNWPPFHHFDLHDYRPA